MSRHHGSAWITFSRKRRAELLPQLPLPCIRCGKPVFPDPRDWVGLPSWHIGHRQDAGLGGRATRENTGPEHASCNLRAGGKAGAAVRNARRRPSTASEPTERGLRPW